MVKLYVADISNLLDPLLTPKLLDKLPEERQQRIHNMKHENSRKQSMGVGLLLQKVLALYHMQDFQLITGESGKPMIEGLEFNLSHSGDMVICVVSDKPVGCDVEKIREAPEGVAERYFSEGEQTYLSQFSGTEYDKAFFRLWTMKESYVKMTGEGMRVPFEEYELFVGDGDGCAKTFRNGEIQDCYLSEVSVPGYVVSICAKSSSVVQVVLFEEL